MALLYFIVSSGVSFAGVASTKHNFGSLSPAAIKTTETTEICVFCHTPHNASPQKPLWNRQVPGDIYNIYASSTMVATVGQPTGSSKLCLSCHDGTIAIGALLNLPGPLLAGTLNVTGPGITPQGTIAPTSAAYMGTDLRDDHPISFDYSMSYPSNSEIKSASAFPPEVKLDSTNKVQCTSCHDPHGTNYPKFMVTSVENGTLCAACHDKRYWNTMPSVHRDSTAAWTGTPGIDVNPWHIDMGNPGYTDDTPAMQSCLACHRSHGGAPAMELLKGINPLTGQVTDEEWTCLNCHNGKLASKDLDPEFGYLSKHDIKGTYGKHKPSRVLPGDPVRESQTDLGFNNPSARHAECADCHNPHGSRSGNHAIGGANGNIIGNNMLGGWGVKPTLPWPAADTAVQNYTVVDFITTNPGGDNLEGYLCIKCHSYYAYGFTPPAVPSGNADGTLVYESDPTADFNINNMSFHPVFGSGKNRPPVTANPNWPANSLGLSNTFWYVDFPGIGVRTGFYNVTHTDTVTCSDCHASSVPSDPQGPHGSNEKWILRTNKTGIGSPKNFCYNCHRRQVYGDEGYVGPNANFSRVSHPVDGLGVSSPFYTVGANTGNNANKFGNLCLTCHAGSHDATNNVIKGAHGSNAAAGTLAGSDPLGFRMMNGACVKSYARPSTTTQTSMQFRVVNTITDKVCFNNFTNFTNGNFANYNCNTIADCSN